MKQLSSSSASRLAPVTRELHNVDCRKRQSADDRRVWILVETLRRRLAERDRTGAGSGEPG